MRNYRTALTWARAELAGLDNPALEAEVLLAHLLGRSRSHLLAWPERALDAVQQRAFAGLIQRRRAGEPLAYITGRREFWSLELEVGPGVLIPRADTELLVELALGLIPELIAELVPFQGPLRIADLGTGSGAIAAAIASERPDCQVLAVERSDAALGIARANLQRLGLGHVQTRQGDWCRAFNPGERFDLILSNPPYIASDDPHLQQGDLPAEPIQALVSGADGLDDLRLISACAPAHLRPGGWLLLEHGFAQGACVRQLLRQAGLEAVRSENDLAGQQRVSLGRGKNGRLPKPAFALG
ncbi:MAG: peptide chain release factor N(5)-glutamine methyltransferase [Gammaproteobacteria bacterium SHHR-1]